MMQSVSLHSFTEVIKIHHIDLCINSMTLDWFQSFILRNKGPRMDPWGTPRLRATKKDGC